MILALQKSRIVVALFDDVEDVRAQITALTMRGIDRDRIGLILTRETFDTFKLDLNGQAGDCAETGSHLDMVALDGTCRACNLLASRGIAPLVNCSAHRFWMGCHVKLGRGGAFETVSRQLQNGCAALIVETENTAEQRQVVRMLLSCSAFPVETHEFNLPR